LSHSFDGRTAVATEVRRRVELRAAGTAEQPRRARSVAPIPAGIHPSIVSLLVKDVRHIAVHLRHEVVSRLF